MTREPDGLLRPDELAETLRLEAELVRTLMEVAEASGLVEDVRYRRCPRCGARNEEAELLDVLAREDVLECGGCRAEFKGLSEWKPAEQSYRFTPETAEDVAAHQRIEAARPRATAVVLCALPVEREAVLAHFDELGEEVHREGTVYKIGALRGRHVDWRVAVAVIGPHTERAASETERAAAFLTPAVIIFCGVAGGVPAQDVELGDVVVAEEVVAYQTGKWAEEGFRPRARIAQAGWGLTQRALNEASSPWQERIKLADSGRRRVHVGQVAAGSQVVASVESEAFKLIEERYDKTLAIEMEGSGVLDAAQKVRNTDGMVVRGISDLLTEKKHTDRQGWQEKAAANAAAFTIHLLVTLTPLTS